MKGSKFLHGVLSMFIVTAMVRCTSREAENQDAGLKGHGILLTNMDTTADPGENFFEYANGGWLKRTEIPGDETRWGAFNELRESNNNAQQKIMQQALKTKNQFSGDQRKAIELYQTGMDSLKAEQVGIKPLQPFFQEIKAMQSKKDLSKVAAVLNKAGIGVLFNDYVYVDRKNSQQYAYYFGQGGLGLPDKDYYLKDTKDFKEIRNDYKSYISKVMKLSGEDEAKAQKAATTILNMETDLAKVSMDRAIARIPDSTYHKMSFHSFAGELQHFDLNSYVKENQIQESEIPEIVINQPAFYKGLDKVIDRYRLDDWKAYLKFHTINAFADVLNYDYVKAAFDFYDAKLKDAQAMRPRWKRVLELVNNDLGQAFGQIYVKEVFPPEAKEKAQAMIQNVREVFAGRIRDLDWMSEETKQKALEKLDAFNVKIGYPDKWKSYEAFKADTTSLVQFIINGNHFSHQDHVDKLGEPVDRSEWFMNPQTVNAYYSPTFNEIVFPAAILQSPFYDYKADKAVNYGGIGAVIGHEMTHGFDDSGRKYNAQGNQQDWWTEEDAKRFEERAKKVADQFSDYTVLDSMHLNGRLTLGENIADLGGVTLAYYAMEKDFQKNGRPEKINGLTPEQRFFINWATVWRTKYRDAALRNQVMTDPHAPGQFRAWAPLSNIKEFQQAFNIKPDQEMVRPDSLRAQIW